VLRDVLLEGNKLRFVLGIDNSLQGLA